MTDKIFEFAKTNEALGKLSETIIRLDAALKNKKQQTAGDRQELQAQLQNKEKQLDGLRAASANVLENIDSIIGCLDNVLENNGSGNDHN